MSSQSNPPIFRKATPADAVPLRALVQSAYRGESSRAGWTHEADIITSGDRIDDAGLLAKIRAPGGQVLLALDPATSALLACCELVRHPAPSETAYFGLFAVSPALQNGGIGRRVLAEAERLARDEMGATTMEMTTLWMRTELVAWYERRGYKVVEGETRPFPFELVTSTGAESLRDDLYFIVLRKDLVAGPA